MPRSKRGYETIDRQDDIEDESNSQYSQSSQAQTPQAVSLFACPPGRLVKADRDFFWTEQKT